MSSPTYTHKEKGSIRYKKMTYLTGKMDDNVPESHVPGKVAGAHIPQKLALRVQSGRHASAKKRISCTETRTKHWEDFPVA